MKPVPDGCKDKPSPKSSAELLVTYHTLCNGLFNLLDLDFAEAFDLEQCLSGRPVDRLEDSQILNAEEIQASYSYSVEAIGFQFGDVSRSNA